MALVRRWIRSRSATHLLHGTTHSWTTSSSPLRYRHEDGNIWILEDDDLIDFSSQNSSTSTIVDDFAMSQQHPQLRSLQRIAPPMIIKPSIQWELVRTVTIEKVRMKNQSMNCRYSRWKSRVLDESTTTLNDIMVDCINQAGNPRISYYL
jgi:hypothetical protein